MKKILTLIVVAASLYACSTANNISYENGILIKAPIKQMRYSYIQIDSLGNPKPDSTNWIINFNEKGKRINQTRVVYPKKNVFRSEYDYFDNGIWKSLINYRNDTITQRFSVEKDKNTDYYIVKEYDSSGNQTYYRYEKYNKYNNLVAGTRYKVDGKINSTMEMETKGKKVLSGKMYNENNQLINEAYNSYNSDNEFIKSSSKRMVKDSLITSEMKYSYDNYDAYGHPQIRNIFENGKKVGVWKLSYSYFQ